MFVGFVQYKHEISWLLVFYQLENISIADTDEDQITFHDKFMQKTNKQEIVNSLFEWK